MLSKHKPLAEKILNPLIAYLSTVNPNVLTLIGSIPSILFFVAVLNHNYILALIFFLGNFLDLFDGMVARKYGKVTAFGGFLDSTLDRVSDFLLITAFGFAGIVGWEIIMPLLLVAFLTSYIRSRGELANPGVSFAVGLIERTERLAIIFVGLLLYTIFPTILFAEGNILEMTFIVLIFFSTITVFQRVMHAYRKL